VPGKVAGQAVSVGWRIVGRTKRFLKGEPIKARRIGKVTRGWRWAYRNPAVTALATTVLVAVLAGTVVSSSSAGLRGYG
jgi:hypothetical protein